MLRKQRYESIKSIKRIKRINCGAGPLQLQLVQSLVQSLVAVSGAVGFHDPTLRRERERTIRKENN